MADEETKNQENFSQFSQLSQLKTQTQDSSVSLSSFASIADTEQPWGELIVNKISRKRYNSRICFGYIHENKMKISS